DFYSRRTAMSRISSRPTQTPQAPMVADPDATSPEEAKADAEQHARFDRGFRNLEIGCTAAGAIVGGGIGLVAGPVGAAVGAGVAALLGAAAPVAGAISLMHTVGLLLGLRQ